MTSCRNVLLLSPLMVKIAQVEAFGARLEPQSSHRGGYGTPKPVLESKMNREKQGCDDVTHPDNFVSLNHLLDAFDFPPAVFDNLNDFSTVYGGVTDGTFLHLQEHADQLAFEAFGGSLPVQETWDDCEEDCDECFIPEEWKNLPVVMKDIDVMDFLGIARVQPLKIPVVVSHEI